jgi:hypothetical protein
MLLGDIKDNFVILNAEVGVMRDYWCTKWFNKRLCHETSFSITNKARHRDNSKECSK